MRLSKPTPPIRALASWISATLLASALFWAGFATFVIACGGGCVDTPLPDLEPQSRIVASWDPLACGGSHRVVIELEDDAGARISRSVPCDAGGITLDLPHWGIYRGRIYAWTYGPEIRSVVHVRLEVDQPVVFWTVDTPR